METIKTSRTQNILKCIDENLLTIIFTFSMLSFLDYRLLTFTQTGIFAVLYLTILVRELFRRSIKINIIVFLALLYTVLILYFTDGRVSHSVAFICSILTFYVMKDNIVKLKNFRWVFFSSSIVFFYWMIKSLNGHFAKFEFSAGALRYVNPNHVGMILFIY